MAEANGEGRDAAVCLSMRSDCLSRLASELKVLTWSQLYGKWISSSQDGVTHSEAS